MAYPDMFAAPGARIGFVDCVANIYDAAEQARAELAARIAGADMARFTAPAYEKIPVAVKKLFDQGCEVVVVFIAASAEQEEAVAFAEQQASGVEISAGKFALFCTLFDSEWSSDEEMQQLAQERLKATIETAVKLLTNPQQLAQDIGKQKQKEELEQSMDEIGKPLFTAKG